jgi:hypothetical protein
LLKAARVCARARCGLVHAVLIADELRFGLELGFGFVLDLFFFGDYFRLVYAFDYFFGSGFDSDDWRLFGLFDYEVVFGWLCFFKTVFGF